MSKQWVKKGLYLKIIKNHLEILSYYLQINEVLSWNSEFVFKNMDLLS